MSKIINEIKEELLAIVDNYKKDNDYDFWHEHIKHVVRNAIALAKENNADLEIVELGALLHDISLPSNYGSREEHHIFSAEITEELLNKYNYPKTKIELVKKCVLNHRNGNRIPGMSIEEKCVADADIISHFDNIPMMFSKAYIVLKLSHADGAKYVKEKLTEDYNDLTPKAKAFMKERYNTIMKALFKEGN